MARYDDLRTGPIAYAAFVSTIILVVVILLVRALCYSWVEAEDEKKLANAHYTSADETIAAQKSRIAKYDKVTIEVAAPPGSPSDAPPVKEERLLIPVSRAKDLLMEAWKTSAKP